MKPLIGSVDSDDQRFLAQEGVQDALQEAKDRLRLAAELTPAILWTTDGELRFTSGSGRGLDALGVDTRQMKGLSLFDYLRTTDPDFPPIAAHRRALSGEPEDYKFSWQGNSYECHVRPLRDAKGNTVGVIGFALDVTEREDVDRILKQSEERSRIMFQRAGIGMALTDLKGHFLDTNPAFQGFLGYSAEELRSLTVHQVSDPDDMAEDVRLMRALLAGEHDRYQMEKRYIRKDGRTVWGRLTLSLVPGPHQQPRFVIGTVEDITDQKRAEEALRESEQRYRAVVESQTELICRWRPDGTLTFVNEAYARHFGKRVDELVGASFMPLIPEEDHEKVRAHFASLSLDSPVAAHEHRVLEPNGGVRWMRWTNQAMFDSEGRLTEFQSVGQDVTARKAAEEALKVSEEQLRQAQKMEAIGRLAGGISHDFNNLLTVIDGQCNLLLKRLDEDDPRRRSAEEIKTAAERAAGLIRQLLAFSRRQVLQAEVLNINSVVTDLGKMLRRLLGEHIQVITNLDPGLGEVRIDHNQFERVILNLAVNSRDAMRKGGSLTISTANASFAANASFPVKGMEPGEYTMLTVADTGCGMDPETLSRVFEPFFTTRGQSGGTGLGLSMVYGIIKQSGGYIDVVSRPGIGTTFRFYLPQSKDDPAAPTEKKETGEMPLGDETVLLVEDEGALRRMARVYLVMTGYTVLEASDGDEALKLAREHQGPINLLLTDVVMPKLSGSKLYRQLAAMRPELRVLFMSGHPDEVVRDHGVSGPDTPLLQKPFSPEVLARRIREVLGEGLKR